MLANKYSLRILFFCLSVAATLSLKSQVPEKASPFTAVKWESEQAVVRWEGDWYHFNSINGIPVETIIDFCKKTYENRWQKRFSEDFVEVLTKMEHQFDEKVTLGLSQNGTAYTKTGIMSEENRREVRNFNNGEDDLARPEGQLETKKNKRLSGTTSKQRLAKQLAAWMDKVWEESPAENTANLRFLFFNDGSIFSGKIDVEGDFIFRAKSITNHVQALNPNSNGRWVYEGLPPGIYHLSITGQNEFDGWSWSKDRVEVTSNTSPVFKVNLN